MEAGTSAARRRSPWIAAVTFHFHFTGPAPTRHTKEYGSVGGFVIP
jgi:hypothetical protein